MSNSLSNVQVPEGICSGYQTSRSTAHSIEESSKLSENGQRAAGLVLASRACHDGNLALLLGGDTTGDRAFTRMGHLDRRPTRFEVQNTCCWWLAVENGCQPFDSCSHSLRLDPTLAALPLGTSIMLVLTGLTSSGLQQSCASTAQASHMFFGTLGRRCGSGIGMCIARSKITYLANQRSQG